MFVVSAVAANFLLFFLKLLTFGCVQKTRAQMLDMKNAHLCQHCWLALVSSQ